MKVKGANQKKLSKKLVDLINKGKGKKLSNKAKYIIYHLSESGYAMFSERFIKQNHINKL